MNDLDSIDQLLRTEFAHVRDEQMPRVLAPGTDALRGSAFHGRRTAAATLAMVAVASVSMAVWMTLATRSDDRSGSVAGAPPTPAATPPPFPIVDGYDLHVVGPARVALTPSDGRYVGELELTVVNSGTQPYDLTAVRVEFPTGLEFWSPAKNVPLHGCVGDPGRWDCMSDAVPARGGVTRWKLPIRVNIAPQSAEQAMTGFRLTAFPAGNESSKHHPDRTPSDNTVLVTFVLPSS